MGMHFYPNKKLFTSLRGGKHLEARHNEVIAERQLFNLNQAQFGKSLSGINLPKSEIMNRAALIPDDAWREVDEETMRIMREDEGEVYMSDLMTMARGVDIGKTAHVYRRSSDLLNRVNVTMDGQTPSEIDKVRYTYEGHPVPIFDTSFGLDWREWRGMQSEGFDGIADDQEAAIANLEQVAAQYVLNGDASIVVNAYEGYGIRNHPETNVMDLDSSGFNIDLASETTTSDNIEIFWTRDVQQVYHNNLIKMPLMVYASKEIERRWSRSYSGSSGFKGGSMHDFLMSIPFIQEIKYTYELDGNEFMAWPMNPRTIRPLMGMATSITAMPRVQMTDNYNFRAMKAMGLEIRADDLGRCGVIYGANIA